MGWSLLSEKDVTLHDYCIDVSFSTCYLIELEGDANDEQIKSAYRRLAKFYHPDGMYLGLSWFFF